MPSRLIVLRVDVANDLPPVRIARHEQLADRVFAGLRQLEAELVGLLGEERVRDLHQDAGAVAGARIGADRAAMLEIAEDRERVLDDLVRLAALDVGDEADAAGILVERRIVEPLRCGQAGFSPVLGRPSGGPVALSAALSCAHAGPRLSRQLRERRNENSKLPLRLLRRGMRLRTAAPPWLVAQDSPAASQPRISCGQLGQQYCPNIPWQILILQTRVRLMGNAAFLPIISATRAMGARFLI